MTEDQITLPPPSDDLGDRIVRLRYLAQWFRRVAEQVRNTNQVSCLARLLLDRDYEEELAPGEVIDDLHSSASRFEDQADYMVEHGKLPALMDYLTNERECAALVDAEQDGKIEPLTQIILETGQLKTQAAREFVAARVHGEKTKRGQKRTRSQIAKELALLAEIRSIQEEHGCSENKARQIYLEQHPDMNDESLKTYASRAKQFFKEFTGKAPRPPL